MKQKVKRFFKAPLKWLGGILPLPGGAEAERTEEERVKEYVEIENAAQDEQSGDLPAPAFNPCLLDERLAEINERLRRMENRQKETSLQIEEIDGFLQGGGNESALVDALIALLGTIEDFYCFAAADTGSPLFEQARMMWNSAQNAAESTGLEIIEAGCEPFDFSRHSVESTAEDCAIPNGYVVNTLKRGYIYRNEIIRRAAVVVNKTADPVNEERIDIL
jgi:molecular chaperone GrpE (heat shock protein)